MTIQQIIETIKSFKDDYVDYFLPIEQEKITEFETNLKIKLPQDYVSFLKFSNGITIDGDELFGIANQEWDLLKVYNREHNLVAVPMFDYIIPFSPDGGGNFYCFDTRHDNKIIFWVSNYAYSSTDMPEVVYENFCAWFKEVMIDWTIEFNGDDVFKK